MGYVSEIEILHTTLTDLDNKSIYLPNGILANNKIVNYYSSHLIRCDLPIELGNDYDLIKTREILLKGINSVE